MNAITKDQQVALTMPERAALALGETANAAKLRELAMQSANIVTVTNPDGREEAHRAGMVLRTTRTNITNTGKAAREDATAFSKAVIAMEKDLIALIQPEEDRVLALRDKFDEELAAEKAAKIVAERARTDGIQRDIQSIRDMPLLAVGKSSAEIGAIIGGLVGAEPGESFDEFLDDAKLARHEALEKLAKAETVQRGIEVEAESRRQEAARIAAEAEAARIAEAERLAAEKVALAAQKAENDRIAAEQKAEAKRLATLAAEQHAAALALQREADAKAKAERDAQAKAAAAQQAIIDAQIAAMAEQSRKLAEQQAAADARDALAELIRQREAAHPEALMMNAEFDVARDAERGRVAAELAAQAVAEVLPILSPAAAWPAPIPKYEERDALMPSDLRIVEMGEECNLDLAAWRERLEHFMVWSRLELAARAVA